MLVVRLSSIKGKGGEFRCLFYIKPSRYVLCRLSGNVEWAKSARDVDGEGVVDYNTQRGRVCLHETALPSEVGEMSRLALRDSGMSEPRFPYKKSCT